MSLLNDAAQWRHRAKRVRALAKHITDGASKRLALKMAIEYEHLADLTERRRRAIAERTAGARALAEAIRKANADRHAANVLPIIREAQKNGARSLREIAAVLTARGVPTRKRGKWHAASVKTVLERGLAYAQHNSPANTSEHPKSNGRSPPSPEGQSFDNVRSRHINVHTEPQ
jgi:hypothetical protein